MLRRIACAVAVCSLLMLWPPAAGAQEDEGKLLVMLEEYHVLPGKASEYEALMKEIVAVFDAHGFANRLDSYKMDDLRYLAVWWFKGTAGMDQMHAEWVRVTEEWGQEEADGWTRKLFGTFSYWKSSIWMPRPDLSYFPENQADKYSYIAWGMMPIIPGHQKELEDLVRESLKIYAKHEVPYAWSAAQGFIGVENPMLSFVEWSASPGTYWTRTDEIHKNEEFMKEAGAVWQKMAPHIRGYERDSGYFLKDLSYRPEKKAEAGENSE